MRRVVQLTCLAGALLVVERVTNGKSPMPSFKDRLTAQQIADVAAYVSESAEG